MRRKSRKKPTYLPRKKEPVHRDLRLLLGKVVIAVGNYLDYPIDEYTDSSMERIFRQYKHDKDIVKDTVKKVFRYYLTDRYVSDPTEKVPYVSKKPKPTKEKVLYAKKQINSIAKKIWK